MGRKGARKLETLARLIASRREHTMQVLRPCSVSSLMSHREIYEALKAFPPGQHQIDLVAPPSLCGKPAAAPASPIVDLYEEPLSISSIHEVVAEPEVEITRVSRRHKKPRPVVVAIPYRDMLLEKLDYDGLIEVEDSSMFPKAWEVRESEADLGTERHSRSRIVVTMGGVRRKGKQEHDRRCLLRTYPHTAA